MIPADLQREMDEKAARQAIWIGLLQAQRLGWHEIAGQLTAILVHVDGLRELSEAQR